MPRTILDEEIVFREYVMNGKSDRQIADEYGCCRTAVVHRRKQFGIATRKTTGEIGERLTLIELKKLGFNPVDMNRTVSKIYPFDIQVDGHVRLDVKSAQIQQDRWSFILTDKIESGISLDSGRYLLLQNGRVKKRYNVSCDFIILCGLSDSTEFFIIPSSSIPIQQNSISISSRCSGRWGIWRDRWDLIENFAV